MMTFSEKLVVLRKIKHLTQDEFASAVGVSRQAVYKWESGQSYPEAQKLIEMKLLFDISIDNLLDDTFEVELPKKKKKKRGRKSAAELAAMAAEAEGVSAAPVSEAPKAEPVVEKKVEEPAPVKVEAPVAAPVVEKKVEEPAPVKVEAPKVAPVAQKKEEPAPVKVEAPKAEEPKTATATRGTQRQSLFEKLFGKK